MCTCIRVHLSPQTFFFSHHHIIPFTSHHTHIHTCTKNTPTHSKFNVILRYMHTHRCIHSHTEHTLLYTYCHIQYTFLNMHTFTFTNIQNIDLSLFFKMLDCKWHTYDICLCLRHLRNPKDKSVSCILYYCSWPPSESCVTEVQGRWTEAKKQSLRGWTIKE